MRARPPPPSPLPRARRLLSWASSRSSSSTRCCSRSTDSVMAGTPAPSAPSPGRRRRRRPTLLACWPREGYVASHLAAAFPAHKPGEALPACPCPTRLRRSCGSPSGPLPVRCSQRSASGKKKKKKPPTSPLRHGLRVQGVPGPWSYVSRTSGLRCCLSNLAARKNPRIFYS